MISEAARLVQAKLDERGWSQADLSRAMEEKGEKVADGLICRWLQGTREPNLTRAALIDELLGVAPKLWAVPAKRRVA